MKLNCYVVLDKVSNTLARIAFGATDGAFCRDNINLDVRSKENPRGLPFNDLQYVKVGRIDTETFNLESMPHEIVDILSSYQFKVESDVKREDVDSSKLDV